MTKPIEQEFPEEIEVLKHMFGKAAVDFNLSRLNTVRQYTERKWLNYITQIPGGVVRYLLIAEAPPGGLSEPPLYFLDPLSKPRTLMQEVSKAFFGNLIYHKIGVEATLQRLAEEGFLMVDSIPFSMKYTSQQRSQVMYKALVGATAKNYMLKKLEISPLVWSSDLQIAFSVPNNARSVIQGLEHKLHLGRQCFQLSEEMIAVNEANYPSSAKLQKIFQLGQ